MGDLNTHLLSGYSDKATPTEEESALASACSSFIGSDDGSEGNKPLLRATEGALADFKSGRVVLVSKFVFRPGEVVDVLGTAYEHYRDYVLLRTIIMLHGQCSINDFYSKLENLRRFFLAKDGMWNWSVLSTGPVVNRDVTTGQLTLESVTDKECRHQGTNCKFAFWNNWFDVLLHDCGFAVSKYAFQVSVPFRFLCKCRGCALIYDMVSNHCMPLCQTSQ
jgi:hypothetical protein